MKAEEKSPGYRYEKQSIKCKEGSILHNNNGSDYRVVETEQYRCMQDFIEGSLCWLEFNSLVSLSEDGLAVAARGNRSQCR